MVKNVSEFLLTTVSVFVGVAVAVVFHGVERIRISIDNCLEERRTESEADDRQWSVCQAER